MSDSLQAPSPKLSDAAQKRQDALDWFDERFDKLYEDISDLMADFRADMLRRVKPAPEAAAPDDAAVVERDA